MRIIIARDWLSDRLSLGRQGVKALGEVREGVGHEIRPLGAQRPEPQGVSATR
jgi:hypothetical protein